MLAGVRGALAHAGPAAAENYPPCPTLGIYLDEARYEKVGFPVQYEAFEFDRFRGIKNTRLDLRPTGVDARVFTLVGLNESGKTTILEAIDHFLPTTDESEVSPKQLSGWVKPDPHDLIPISERTNFNGKVNIKATLRLDDEDVAMIKKGVAKRIGFRIKEIHRSIEVTVQFAFKDSKFSHQRTLWPNELGSGLLPTGRVTRPVTAKVSRPTWLAVVAEIRARLPNIWYFPNFLFEFPRKIILTSCGDETVQTATNRFYRLLFQDILDSLDKQLTVDAHVVQRALSDAPADRANLRQLLRDASRNVTQNIVTAWSQLFQNEDLTEKRVNIELFTEGDVSSPGKQQVFVKFLLEDADGEFEIHERSQGFRWFFVYLLLTTYRGRRRKGESDILFLFDEPASNLHSRAQAALLDGLKRLSASSFIIYTTHSHHMVDPMWLSSTYVVMNEGVDPRAISADVAAPRTDIRVQGLHSFAAQHPNRSYYFQPVLDILEYSPSHLELVPAVVLVEGKTDYYLLRYFQEVYLGLTEAECLKFLPGTGAGSLTTVIQLYLAWSRQFVVLLDSDNAGDREARRYMEKLGVVLRDKIISLKMASGHSDVSSIESLLTLDDLITFQRITAPDSMLFKKKTFSQGVQEAFAGRAKVDLSAFATANLTAVLEYLGTQLRSS